MLKPRIFSLVFYIFANVDSICTLTCPNADNPVAAPLGHVAVLNSYTLHHSRRSAPFFARNARAAVPLPPFYLVVYLDYVLSRSTDDPSDVEHHAGDGVVVSIRIGNRSGP